MCSTVIHVVDIVFRSGCKLHEGVRFSIELKFLDAVVLGTTPDIIFVGLSPDRVTHQALHVRKLEAGRRVILGARHEHDADLAVQILVELRPRDIVRLVEVAGLRVRKVQS